MLASKSVTSIRPTTVGICPIETPPEGPNIGLITFGDLCAHQRVRFIEAPYRKVVEGASVDELSTSRPSRVTSTSSPRPTRKWMDSNRFCVETVSARSAGDFITATPDKIEYMDVSPKQVVSVATALVPFLEHDDANRALMGSKHAAPGRAAAEG